MTHHIPSNINIDIRDIYPSLNVIRVITLQAFLFTKEQDSWAINTHHGTFKIKVHNLQLFTVFIFSEHLSVEYSCIFSL
jgi:hypothetical protein